MQRSNSSSTGKQPLLRAGWLAFLLIKSQLLPGFPDLVRCVRRTATAHAAAQSVILHLTLQHLMQAVGQLPSSAACRGTNPNDQTNK